ncbi:hypothetical protein Y032_0003g1327 [Ancylostoma ceylanicum]|uniref:Uncharacterized protein n=1 Tax=Ancylostoma ceylanicum TaxID=53326 RepID=A0A016VX17_9BILA|nr:hypothetical protein Y032_0003g1327 [Ancylostoma ceylanicum]
MKLIGAEPWLIVVPRLCVRQPTRSRRTSSGILELQPALIYATACACTCCHVRACVRVMNVHIMAKRQTAVTFVLTRGAESGASSAFFLEGRVCMCARTQTHEHTTK